MRNGSVYGTKSNDEFPTLIHDFQSIKNVNVQVATLMDNNTWESDQVNVGCP